jgi:hypothetical protein
MKEFGAESTPTKIKEKESRQSQVKLHRDRTRTGFLQIPRATEALSQVL